MSRFWGMTYLTQQVNQRLKELDWSPELGLNYCDFDDMDTFSLACLLAILASELCLGERDPESLRLLPQFTEERRFSMLLDGTTGKRLTYKE
jgi:hypothetical protein